MKKLTDRQRLFVHEYLVDLNATQAAIRSGFSARTAKQQAHALLKKPAIKKLIDSLRERREIKTIMTRDEVLEELSIIGRFDLQKYQVIEEGGTIRVKTFKEMDAGASRALKSLRESRTIAESKDGKETNLVTDNIVIEGFDKPKALQLLGQHYGLFPTKVDGKLELQAKLTMDTLQKSMKEVKDGSGS